MDLQGTVKKVTDLQTFNSGFQKRELILMTEEQYPQPISIEFLQDKAELPTQFSEGDRVKVGINIRGREWTSPDNVVKYFNSIVGWRVEKLEADAVSAQPTSAPQSSTPAASASATDVFAEDEDDLPF